MRWTPVSWCIPSVGRFCAEKCGFMGYPKVKVSTATSEQNESKARERVVGHCTK